MKQGGEQGQKETELKKNTKLTGGHIGILSSRLKKKRLAEPVSPCC